MPRDDIHSCTWETWSTFLRIFIFNYIILRTFHCAIQDVLSTSRLLHRPRRCSARLNTTNLHTKSDEKRVQVRGKYVVPPKDNDIFIQRISVERKIRVWFAIPATSRVTRAILKNIISLWQRQQSRQNKKEVKLYDWINKLWCCVSLGERKSKEWE